MQGMLIHPDYAGLLAELWTAKRSGRLTLHQPRQNSRRHQQTRPPIICLLLEDLANNEAGDAAVLTVQRTNSVQMVTLLGMIGGGDFKLKFGDDWTDPIKHDATAAELRVLLEGLPSIEPGDVEVAFGKLADPGGGSYRTGRWLITFTGRYEGLSVPLMDVDGSDIDGFPNLTVNAQTQYEDTGRTESVRLSVPVGEPTPAKAGAIGAALWFPRMGYRIIALECRKFDPDADPYADPYGDPYES